MKWLLCFCSIIPIIIPHTAMNPYHFSGEVKAHMDRYIHNHKHAHVCAYTRAHTYTPDSSLFCMSLPKADIFGLPCTEAIMPQAIMNASLVHVLSKQSWRVEFRCLGPSAFAILSRTPSGIMPWYTKSLTTVLASISAINRTRYSFRTSSAVYIRKEKTLEKHTTSTHAGLRSQYVYYSQYHSYTSTPQQPNMQQLQHMCVPSTSSCADMNLLSAYLGKDQGFAQHHRLGAAVHTERHRA